jgi:hypothetical protein
MTLKEFVQNKDRNKFWKLSSGKQENLLDEAIDTLDDIHALRAVYGADLRTAIEIAGNALGCECCQKE